MDESPKGERAGASESIEAKAHAHSKRVSDAQSLQERSRRESNPHLRFRKPPFYPLNYGNKLRFFLFVSPVCVTLSSLWQKNAEFITGNGLRKSDQIFIAIRSVGTICSSKKA